jgi:hypothetical protein
MVAFIISVGYLSTCIYGWQSGQESNLNWAVLFCFVMALLFTWACWNLKEVSIDDQGLYVSSREGEVLVRFSEIAEVTESKASNGTITVVLKKAKEVGRKIIFIPSVSRPPFKTNPIADEIHKKMQ